MKNWFFKKFCNRLLHCILLFGFFIFFEPQVHSAELPQETVDSSGSLYSSPLATQIKMTEQEGIDELITILKRTFSEPEDKKSWKDHVQEILNLAKRVNIVTPCYKELLNILCSTANSSTCNEITDKFNAGLALADGTPLKPKLISALQPCFRLRFGFKGCHYEPKKQTLEVLRQRLMRNLTPI